MKRDVDKIKGTIFNQSPEEKAYSYFEVINTLPPEPPEPDEYVDGPGYGDPKGY